MRAPSIPSWSDPQTRRSLRIWLDPVSVLVACTVSLLLGMAGANLGSEEERQAASRASYQAQELARQIEELLDEQAQALRRFAELAQAEQRSRALFVGSPEMEELLRRTRTITAFGNRSPRPTCPATMGRLPLGAQSASTALRASGRPAPEERACGTGPSKRTPHSRRRPGSARPSAHRPGP
jgi:hypothetical protein